MFRLNPCFNGILKYGFEPEKSFGVSRLNPCFNGILKYRYGNFPSISSAMCLNPCFNGILKYLNFRYYGCKRIKS